MKRSRINAEIKNAMEICKRLSFFLPDFAGWSPGTRDLVLRMK